METGLPPSELLADTWMLRAIIAYMEDRNKRQNRAARRS